MAWVSRGNWANVSGEFRIVGGRGNGKDGLEGAWVGVRHCHGMAYCRASGSLAGSKVIGKQGYKTLAPLGLICEGKSGISGAIEGWRE